MKKIIWLLIAVLTVTLAAGALGEMSFEGVIVSEETETVTAPFGGIVEKITVREGSLIHTGETLAQLSTTRVFSPLAGTVAAVFAEEGDSLEAVSEQYGGVVYIEPVHKYTVTATTEKAYSASETKMIHIGETVYLTCAQDGSHQGHARVSAIGETDDYGNTAYTLEVQGGEFFIGETVDIFRTEKYAASSRLGRGTVKQAKPAAVKASGSLIRLHVKRGDIIEKGEILFETAEGVLDGLWAPSPTVVSPVEGIIAKIAAETGSTVSKDANLVTIYPISALQAEVSVPVTEISTLKEGRKVIVELDIGADEPLRYPGTVESVSYLVTGEKRDMHVSAYVSFEADENVRFGMPVIVYPLAQDAQAPAVTEAQTEEKPE